MTDSRPSYLFLVAVGRSGTTAVRKSLWQHPDICYNGRENNIIPDVVEAANKNWTRPERKHGITVSQEVYERAFETLTNEIVWHDCGAPKVKVRFASFAMFIEQAELLLKIFPNARILHLIRNGIEVVASRQLFGHFQYMPFEEHCKRWARTYEWYQWGQTHPEIYRLIRYEALKEEQVLRTQLQQLYQWLNIPWDDAPLKHMMNERYHPTIHPKETKSEETNPANGQATHEHRWQYWTPEQRATFEELCGSTMQAFGYPMPWQSNTELGRADAQKTHWLKSIYTRAARPKRA